MNRLEEIKDYTDNTDWQPKANSLWFISEIERLKRDIKDMNNSRQARFERCDECGHLHDYNYQCIYCLEETNE